MKNHKTVRRINKKNDKNITKIIAMSVGLFFGSALVIQVVVQTLGAIGGGVPATQVDPAEQKERYLKLVDRNCPQGGFTQVECRCVYSYMIDEYGVKETAALDKRFNDSGVISDEFDGALNYCGIYDGSKQ